MGKKSSLYDDFFFYSINKMTQEEFNKQPVKFSFDLSVPEFTYPIPTFVLKNSDPITDAVAVYVHGLNGTKDSLNFLTTLPREMHVIGYDLKACGLNKNPATNHYMKYADELFYFLKALKKELRLLNIKKYFLIGESFGAGIVMMFLHKHDGYVDGAVTWNMPRKIVDVSGQKWSEKLALSIPLIWTLITNLPTYAKAPKPSDVLSNNRLLIRVNAIKKTEISDNRSVIAAWLGSHKAWRILLSNNFMNKLKTKLIYFSCETDVLRDKKALKSLSKKYENSIANNFLHYHLQKGTHVLIYDVEVGRIIIDALDLLNSSTSAFDKAEVCHQLQLKEEDLLQAIRQKESV